MVPQAVCVPLLALAALAAPRPLAPAPPPPAGPATAAQPSRISAAALQADLDLLRRALETVHPGLYRYLSPRDLDARFDAARAVFASDRTRAEAFLELSRLTAAIRCGHTFLNPANQSRAALDDLTAGATRLPLFFRWIDGRIIVTAQPEIPADSPRIPPGSEVLSINGIPAADILRALLPLTRADGHNDAKRIAQLDLSGRERFEPFDLFFPLLFPPADGAFVVRFRPPDAADDDERSATLRGLTQPQRAALAAAAAPQPPADAPLWSLSFWDDGTAYLPMASWVAYKTRWNWRGFIDDVFRTLDERGTRHLIIDLRGNEGGSDVGEEILAHLIDTPAARSPFERLVRYTRTPDDLNATLDTWDNSFRDRSADLAGPADLADRPGLLTLGRTAGFFRLRDPRSGSAGPLDTIAPVPPRCRARVFVLIDASNSSATFQFAEACKRLRVATLVGRPTGGNLRGINGGAYFFLRLPGSGLEIDLPQIGYFPRAAGAAPPDSGVEPDILVPLHPRHIAADADPDLAAVRALIAKPDRPSP